MVKLIAGAGLALFLVVVGARGRGDWVSVGAGADVGITDLGCSVVMVKGIATRSETYFLIVYETLVLTNCCTKITEAAICDALVLVWIRHMDGHTTSSHHYGTC